MEVTIGFSAYQNDVPRVMTQLGESEKLHGSNKKKKPHTHSRNPLINDKSPNITEHTPAFTRLHILKKLSVF